MMTSWVRAGLWLLAATVVFAMAATTYRAGADAAASERNAHWQKLWDARDLADSQARETAERNARETEQAERARMDQLNREKEKRLEEIRGDAAGVFADNDRLRKQVDRLLAANRASQGCGVAPDRPATKNAGDLLAVVLEKSVERNRELAAFADLAMNAAQTCWAAKGRSD